MKTPYFLTANALRRCSMALLAIAATGLAAGCAWFFLPGSAARAADLAPDSYSSPMNAAYLEARLLLATGQPEQAAARLENCRKLPDCPADVYASLAEAYLLLNNSDKAREALKDGQLKCPGEADLFLMQARVEDQDSHYDQALAALDEALKLAPRRQGILERMSDLRLKKIRQVKSEKELDVQVGELIKVYEQMLQTRQGLDRIPPLLVLSSLYLRTPAKERAIEAAQEAVRIHPREARCRLALGAAQESLGRNGDAIKTYHDLLLLAPGNEEAHSRIDKLAVGPERPGLKRQFFGDLARERPDEKALQLDYASTLVAEKAWTEAEDQLIKITRRWPEESQSRLELARVWVALKRPDEAVAAVRKLCQDDKAMAPLANLSLAEALITQGDRARALAVLDEFEKTGKNDNANVTAALASLLLEANEYARALAVLEPFHKRWPEVYGVTLLLAQTYVLRKRYDDAQALLTGLPETVKKQREDDILRLQADLYRRQKKWDKALDLLQALMQKNRTDAQLVMDAGTINQEMGRKDEAEKLFQQAISMAPADAETYNTLGYFYAETNQKLEMALELVNKALKLKPDAGNIVDSLGWVYYRQGNYQAAVDALKRAVKLMEKTPDAVVYEHLGDALEKLGQFNEARDAWNRSLSLDGDAQQVKDKLARTK